MADLTDEQEWRNCVVADFKNHARQISLLIKLMGVLITFDLCIIIYLVFR